MRKATLQDRFVDDRRRLFQVAYRMMGSVADAEDILQEAFVRIKSAKTEHVRVAGPYFTRVVVRLCLDCWKSARKRRENYIGSWLPEPIVSGDPAPEESAEFTESLSLALLVVLESLDPVQRAVFLLHDVFGYPFDEVAAIVEKTPAGCRQIASRARREVARRRPRFDVDTDQHRRIVNRFLAVCRTGDVAEIHALLTDDARLESDSGGQVPAARVPLVGADRIARFFFGLQRKLRRWEADVEIRPATVNGAPGAVQYLNGCRHAVIAIDLEGDLVREILMVMNPDKLAVLDTCEADLGGDRIC